MDYLSIIKFINNDILTNFSEKCNDITLSTVYMLVPCFCNPFMTTWYFDSHAFSKNSLTEIVVLPSVKIHKILINISKQFNSVVFIDTVGNLTFYNEYNSLNLTIINTTSIRKLLRVLKELLMIGSETAIIIDSISFFSDINVPVYAYLYSVLVDLQVKCNCTLICTNHYRRLDKNCFAPKLGAAWNRIVNYKITYKYNKDKIFYEVDAL